ncbi:MAG: hypothetical protein V1655_03710 [bacterium]
MFREGNIFNTIKEKVQGIVNECNLPTEEKLGYESTVGVYGGKLKINENGRMVYDNTGFTSKVDRFGDAVLRTYDEHLMKNPVEVLKKHPKWFFRFLHPGTKRYRGNTEEIAQNAKELGLGDLYDVSPDGDGVEIKNHKVFQEGRALQDIYRADLIGSEDLEEIDRFEALGRAAEYVGKVHQESDRGIGELLASDIIFRKKENGEISDPVLNLPDIVWNKEKNISSVEQKATDMLDFMLSVGIEELRHSQNWDEVEKALKIIKENYTDKKVIAITGSLVKRGRITFISNENLENISQASLKITGLHNQARFGTNKGELMANLKELIAKVAVI